MSPGVDLAPLDGRGQLRNEPELTTLWIEFIKSEGTKLYLRKPKEPYPVAASCTNRTGGLHEVTLETLQPCVGPEISIHQISQRAEKETLNVTIGWRFGPTAILAETLHTVKRGNFSSQTHGITFAGNLDSVFRAASHVAGFSRATEATMAAMPTSQFSAIYPSSEASFGINFRDITVTPDMAPWGQGTSRRRSLSPRYGSPFSDSGAVRSGTVTRATRRPMRQQDRRRIHTSRLVQAYNLYADRVYRSTGDTSEVVRSLELSRMVAASRLQ